MATLRSLAMRAEVAVKRIDEAKKELGFLVPVMSINAPVDVPSRDPEIAKVQVLEAFADWAEKIVAAVPSLLGADTPTLPDVSGSGDPEVLTPAPEVPTSAKAKKAKK